MQLDLRSTSTRTFVLWPAIVASERLLTRRPLRVKPLSGALIGYLLYLGAGRYRTARGGGGPGMQVPPDELVTDGPYAVTRNPMYLGHLVAFAAYAAATRSMFFAAVFGWHLRWFDERAARDERGLEETFGAPYVAYRDRVPRWLPEIVSSRRHPPM